MALPRPGPAQAGRTADSPQLAHLYIGSRGLLLNGGKTPPILKYTGPAGFEGSL